VTRARDIAAAATANFRAHATFPSRGIPGATVRESGALTWVDSGLDTDTFNIVLGSRLAPEEVAGALREIADHFGSVGQPFSWWVAPGDQPEDLVERLETGGLVREEYELAMSVDLEAARLVATPGVDWLRIDRARTAEQVFEFARINAENWSPPDPNVETCYARSRDTLLSAESPHALVGSLEGKASRPSRSRRREEWRASTTFRRAWRTAAGASAPRSSRRH
jgi:hypothetical protein